MAARIAVAHPRNMLKHVGPLGVPNRGLQAIVAAILLEAGKGDLTEVEAGEMLLRCVEELRGGCSARPSGAFPAVDTYFTEFEYRGDP